MTIDVAALLQPVPGDQPGGVELNDQDRDDIERSLADALLPPNAPRPVSREKAPLSLGKAMDVIQSNLSQSKDLWLGVFLSQAGASAGNLDALAAGAEIAAGLLQDMWDDCYPNLDDGVEARTSACEALGSFRTLGRRLSDAPLWRTARNGAFTGGDFAQWPEGPRRSDLAAAFAAQGPGDLRVVAAGLQRFLDGLTRIDEAFMAKAPNAAAVFDETQKFVGEVLRGINAVTGGQAAAPAAVANAPNTPSAEAGGAAPAKVLPPDAPAPAPGARIGSREDVAQALDEICAFYKVQEPGSPIPMVLERVKGWIGMSFLDVLKEVAPNGVPEARRMLVKQED